MSRTKQEELAEHVYQRAAAVAVTAMTSDRLESVFLAATCPRDGKVYRNHVDDIAVFVRDELSYWLLARMECDGVNPTDDEMMETAQSIKRHYCKELALFMKERGTDVRKGNGSKRGGRRGVGRARRVKDVE